MPRKRGLIKMNIDVEMRKYLPFTARTSANKKINILNIFLCPPHGHNVFFILFN